MRAAVLGVLSSTDDDTSATEVPADVEAVVDAYTGAFDAGDVEQWLDTVTEGFFHRRFICGQGANEQMESFNEVGNSIPC